MGRYKNFPEVIHGVARFFSQPPTVNVQRAILDVLHQLNRKAFGLQAITSYSSEECEVSFEFGIAEDVEFNYLDEETLGRFQKGILEKELPVLDFLCVVRYHFFKDKRKRVPLRFDYHLFRFMFYKNSVEFRVCHERGVQRLPLEDLVNFLAKQINNELIQKQLKPMDLEYLRTLY